MDERALLEVAFCADTTWTNGCDPFQQANKLLLHKVLQSKDSVDNKQENKMPPSSENKSNVCLGAKTVRDVIPASRLATYGNYQYDQVLERLYVRDVSSTEYHFDSPKSGTQEAWMLQGVEDLFQKYTAPLSSGVSGCGSSVKNTSVSPENPSSLIQSKNDIYSFFQDKCTINTDSEVALAKRIRCDEVKRLWDTPCPDTRTRPPTNLPPGPRKQTTTRMDTQIPSQYFLARQYQLWGCGSEFIPVPVSTRDNPYSLFEYNEVVATKKPAYFFPSSSEVSNSGELFPYLQEGLPIPTHTPSYAIPVIQSSQQTRSHSSGSPPAAKRIPVYQRPVEQQPERRRHGADLSNLICLSKHGERRSEDEPPPPGVDANPEVSSDINWLLLNYHPRVTTFQQSSHLADELLVMERQMDEVVAMATEALGQSPNRPVTPTASVNLELEKDFPPINLSQKRVKSMKRNPGPTPTPLAEISVDVSGVWGPRRTYKDACVNETQLSPDSAGGFGNEVDDEYEDDDEPLPDSIPDSFWAPVVKDDLEHWPALVDTSLRRSPCKQDEMTDDESDRVSIKETKTTTSECLEVIEDVQEVAVEEKKLADAVGMVPLLEVVAARRSDEDLANKYQGIKEQALETIAVNRKGDDAVRAQEGVDLEESTLLEVPRLDKGPSVDVGESSSDDESPYLRWSTPTSEGGYVVFVDMEPRLLRIPVQCTILAPVIAPVTDLNSTLPVASPAETEPCTPPLPPIASADAIDVLVVSPHTTLPEETTAPPTKPAWLRQSRKKAPGRRKQNKLAPKPKVETPACCVHSCTPTERNILVRIERELRGTRAAACEAVLHTARRVANRRDARVGTDGAAQLDPVDGPDLRTLLDLVSGHCLKSAWDFARALMPPECSVCLGRVGGILERIREHTRAMDAYVWENLTGRVAALLCYLVRLREMARAAEDWDCSVDRDMHFYELRHRTVVLSSSAFFDSFLPALTYSYDDNVCFLRNRWSRREETVCLRSSVFVSARSTTLVGYLTNACEDGAFSTVMHTTTFSPHGIYFLHQPRPYTPPPPLRAAELSAWSVMSRLDSALNRFLRGEADVTPVFAATPGLSVGTQTDARLGKNRIKALSKQLFHAPPPAPKKKPSAPPTQAPCDAGVGQGDAPTPAVCKQGAPSDVAAKRYALRARSALAKKRALVSHIPVPTRARKQLGVTEVRSGEPDTTTAPPEVTKPQAEPVTSTRPPTPSRQAEDQGETEINSDATAPASKAGICTQGRPSLGVCNCNARRPSPTPTPTGPRTVPCGTPPARATSGPPRRSTWIPEQLRQATARLFKRGTRKQVTNKPDEGVTPDAVAVTADPQTSPANAVIDVKKRLESTMDGIGMMNRENAEARRILERCTKLMASLGDRPEAGRKGDDVGQGREGNGDAAITGKLSAAAVSPEQEEGPRPVGDRGDCDLLAESC